MPWAHDIFFREVYFDENEIMDQADDWYNHKNSKKADEIDVTTISSEYIFLAILVMGLVGV